MSQVDLLTLLKSQPSSFWLTLIVATVLGVVVFLAASRSKSTTDKHDAPHTLTKSKSMCDVSVGLRNEELRSSASCTSLAAAAQDERVLSAAAFREFKVLKVTKVSHNTKLIRFEIPHGKSLGLSIGRHITVRARINNHDGEAGSADTSTKVMRAYTPTSRPDQQGYFDLLVKSYEYGKLSPYLHCLRPGSAVEVRGPVGRFKYSPNRYTAPQSMGLIAGGTGLTPCLQVIRCVLEGQGDKSSAVEDKTCFTLLFQNRTEEDILLREELDALVAKFPKRLRVIYFLSNPTGSEFGASQAKGGARSNTTSDGYGTEVRGYINEQVVQSILRPERCPYVCVCGPSGFNACVKKLLEGVGHVDEAADSGDQVGNPTIYTF